MFGDQPKKYPQNISFLLLPGFSMIGFSAMVAPLRWANSLSEQPVYSWNVVSLNGKAIKSSDELSLLADHRVQETEQGSLFIVCAGLNPQALLSKRLLAVIRKFASMGQDIGAQDTGSYILAAAGVLDGYRATIHWENQESFRDAFPDVKLVEELFEIDRNRFSCSGGLSGLDMMLHLVKIQHGPKLAATISEKLIYVQGREGSSPQRLSLQSRYGTGNKKLLVSIEKMHLEIEQPLSISQLARNVQVSERELERLFKKYLQSTPVAFYRGLRLAHARTLLQQTTNSIAEISVRSGFGSSSHFSRSYRSHYGYPPSEERTPSENWKIIMS